MAPRNNKIEESARTLVGLDVDGSTGMRVLLLQQTVVSINTRRRAAQPVSFPILQS